MNKKSKPESMKLSEIQELIKFVVKSGASEVTYEVKGLKLTIKTHGTIKNGNGAQHIVLQAPAPVAISAPVAAEKKTSGKKSEIVPTAETPGTVIIKSPMIGTFYRSPSPDKPPFVNVGDEIKKGQPICIIEAMKLFNEIESEFSGKILKVLAEDASPVEYDQPLFLIEPK